MNNQPKDRTSAARNARLRKALEDAGGRMITVRLTPEAAAALDALAVGKTKNQAICNALVAQSAGTDWLSARERIRSALTGTNSPA